MLMVMNLQWVKYCQLCHKGGRPRLGRTQPDDEDNHDDIDNEDDDDEDDDDVD